MIGVAVGLVALVVVLLLNRGNTEAKALVTQGPSATESSPSITPAAPSASPSIVKPPPVLGDVSPSPSASPQFTAAEQALLQRVPESHRSYCVSRPGEYPAGHTAALTCRTTGDEVVIYNQMSGRAAMYQAFNQLRGGTVGGSCAKDVQAESGYTIGGKPAGRILCFQGGSREDASLKYAWLVWTDDKLLILSWAYSPNTNGRVLYRWWVNVAGPTR